jgi:tetratricopeptide (TPR) repeat protein
MKKVRILLISTILSLVATLGYAQGALAGASEECRLNLSFYNDWMKQDNYAEAAPLWREAFRLCPPGVRQGLYQDGQKLFKYFIEKNKDNPKVKNALIDSLLMMYDLRIQYFPGSAKMASEFKVYDMDHYLTESDEKIFSAIEKAMELGGDQTEPSILVLAMQKVSGLYAAKKVTTEKVLETYTRIEKMIDAQVVAKHQDADAAKKDIDNLFATSGVASCANIVELFTPRFEANPNDKALVTTIVKLLSDLECTNEELFLRTVQALHKMEPNYQSAYYLYKLCSAKGDHSTAIKMLQEAIDSDATPDEQDAALLLELSDYYMRKMENIGKAAEAAKLAIQKSPTVAGKANLIIGLVWGSLRCTGNEIEVRAKYWVAVDYLIRARNADPSIAEEATRYISTYSQYFPAQEEAFMYNIIDGSSYTVNCNGMSAVTTVRTRK